MSAEIDRADDRRDVATFEPIRRRPSRDGEEWGDEDGRGDHRPQGHVRLRARVARDLARLTGDETAQEWR